MAWVIRTTKIHDVEREGIVIDPFDEQPKTPGLQNLDQARQG